MLGFDDGIELGCILGMLLGRIVCVGCLDGRRLGIVEIWSPPPHSQHACDDVLSS